MTDERDPWERWGLTGTPASTETSKSTDELIAEMKEDIPKANTPIEKMACQYKVHGHFGKFQRCDHVALPNERYCRKHLDFVRATAPDRPYKPRYKRRNRV